MDLGQERILARTPTSYIEPVDQQTHFLSACSYYKLQYLVTMNFMYVYLLQYLVTMNLMYVYLLHIQIQRSGSPWYE